MRSLMLDLHAWMGAFASLFVLGVTVSGILMLFSGSLLELETAALSPVEARTDDAPPDLDAYIASAAQLAGSSFIPLGYLGANSEVITDAEMIYGLSAPPEAAGEIQIVGFSPATGEATGSFLLDRTITHHVIDFHYTLLAGEVGLVFVAVIGLLMTLLAVLGLYLWWPGRLRVSRKLQSFAVSGPLIRKSFRLHSLVGFWLSLAVIVWALTGVYWSKPDWFPESFTPNVDRLPGSFAAGIDGSTCQGSVSPGMAAAVALERYPGARLFEAEFAAPGRPYHTIYLSTGRDMDRHDGDVRVWVHASCVDAVASRTLTGLGVVGALGQSIHSGRIFGPLRTPIVLLIGFALVLLSITGLHLWWRRFLRRAGNS